MTARARELARSIAVWLVIEGLADRPAGGGALGRARVRQTALMAPSARSELRRGTAGQGVAALRGACRMTSRHPELCRLGAQRVTPRARTGVLAMIERGAELGGLGRRSIGDQMSPWLGRVMAGAADFRFAGTEIGRVTTRARCVTADDDLALRRDWMTRHARSIVDELLVVATMYEPGIRPDDVELLGRLLGVALRARIGGRERAFAVVAVRAIADLGARQLGVVGPRDRVVAKRACLAAAGRMCAM
jgi:hypothetical protein